MTLTQVDNASEFKKIYECATDALASLIKSLEASGNLDELIDELFDADLPEFEALTTFPTITSVKISLINLIRNNELPSLLDLYYTYRYSYLFVFILSRFVTCCNTGFLYYILI